MKHFFFFLLACMHFFGFAQTLPANFSRQLVDNGLSSPTAFAFAPDGRVFVTQQGGALRVIKNGDLLSTPAITLTTTSSGERGLLGVAVDPDFESNNYVYLYYTVPAGTERTEPFNKIVRFTFDGDEISSSTAQTVLELNDLSSATNHNGGALAFGPDGKLYIAVGDNANGSNSQNLDNYLGKMLRINADGSVPDGNPFTGNDAKSRIWAYGLRNPYTFTFDRITGKLFVNDVGENSWEEINDATAAGLNFGWPSKEGVCTSGCTGFTDPVFAYAHDGDDDETGCSIIGGTFFNPVSTTYPVEYRGKYFFNEFCNDWINYIDPESPTAQTSFGTDVAGNPTYLHTGPDGNLYYLSRGDGALYRIEYNSGGDAPEITTQPDSLEVTEGSEIALSVVVSGTGPFTYQWMKNNLIIPDADESTLTIESAAEIDEGVYTVLVTSDYGSVLSNTAFVQVDIATVIRDPFDGQDFRIMPNPGTERFYLEFRYPTAQVPESATIKSLRGEEIMTVTNLEEEINLSGLAPGAYFMMINGQAIKVIKQ